MADIREESKKFRAGVTEILSICLDNVKFRAYHGVYDFERRNGGDFIVNLRVDYPSPLSAKELESDDIERTISYVDLYEIVKEEMANPRNLLETVVKDITSRIVTSFPQVTTLECSLTKVSPPIPDFTGSATVTYTWQKP